MFSFLQRSFIIEFYNSYKFNKILYEKVNKLKEETFANFRQNQA